MHAQSSGNIVVSGSPSGFPITLRQTNAMLREIPGLALLGTLAAFIIAPQLGLAIYAVASPDVRSAMAAQPTIAIELVLALAFWAGLVVWPMRSLLLALFSDRFVDIRDGEVQVVDRNLFSKTRWQLPLEAYEGIAVRVRSSISGARQEAVLMHSDRSRSIILRSAEHIGRGELEELSRLLGLPYAMPELPFRFAGEVSSRENPVAA